jgi:hypothetical protein
MEINAEEYGKNGRNIEAEKERKTKRKRGLKEKE